MMRDAEAHAEEDRQRRDEAEIRNSGESLQFGTERFLTENGDKLPEDKRNELETALAELKTALGGTSTEAIKTAQEKVSRISQEAGGAMYEAAQAAGASAPGPDASAGAASTPPPVDDDAVVDAEVVDEGPEGHEGEKK